MTTDTSPLAETEARAAAADLADADAPASRVGPRRGLSASVRLLLLAVAVGVIGVAIWLLSASSPAGTTATSDLAKTAGGGAPPRAGAPLPPLEIKMLDGRTVNLSDLKGKRVVLNFWATWCPPCRAELPDLARIFEEQRSAGLEVIAIDVQEDEPQVSRYLREIGGLPFTIGMDEDGAISRHFAVTSLPTSLFVDDEGIIRLTYVGGMNYTTVQRKLKQTVEEQEYARTQQKDR